MNQVPVARRSLWPRRPAGRRGRRLRALPAVSSSSASLAARRSASASLSASRASSASASARSAASAARLASRRASLRALRLAQVLARVGDCGSGVGGGLVGRGRHPWGRRGRLRLGLRASSWLRWRAVRRRSAPAAGGMPASASMPSVFCSRSSPPCSVSRSAGSSFSATACSVERTRSSVASVGLRPASASRPRRWGRAGG